MFNRSICTSILCASLLCSGCLQEVSVSGDDGDIQSNESAFVSGGIESTVALHPNDFRIGARALGTASQSPLSGSPLSPNVAGPALNSTSIFNSDGGKNSLRVAMHCALGDGDFLMGGVPKETYPGGGILKSAKDWRTQPLSDAAAGDMFACVAAHINADGVRRAIRLEGPQVNSKVMDDNFFDFKEAVFVAVPQKNAPWPQIHVWPRSDLVGLCGGETETSLKFRLCGIGHTGADECNVIVHQPSMMSDECTGVGNQLTCMGRAAVVTTIRSDDLSVFHPLCVAPSGEAE